MDDQKAAVPSEFHWVKARLSPEQVGKLLLEGCKVDVEDRNSVSEPGEEFVFRIRESRSDNFAVIRDWLFALTLRIFKWSDEGSVVVGLDRAEPSKQTEILRATIVPHEDGECRLIVGNESLKLWQFRMRALEDFFWPKKSV